MNGYHAGRLAAASRRARAGRHVRSRDMRMSPHMMKAAIIPGSARCISTIHVAKV